MLTDRDQHWMQYALNLAAKAAQMNEVPVGAVLIKDDTIIGEGCNASITECDPTAHAEIMALRAGATHVGNYRLLDTTLYVTLEPCLMCAGALVHARIARLVYGAPDYKAGVVMTREQILAKPYLNHRIEHHGGLMALECGNILSDFFKSRR
jgi:tRNA(adenine34) deaminase